MGVDSGGWGLGGWGGGEFAFFFLILFLFFFFGGSLDGWSSKSGLSEIQSFSGEEGGVEGGGGGGAGGKKPVIVAMSFALLSWNSLEGLKQQG